MTTESQAVDRRVLDLKIYHVPWGPDILDAEVYSIEEALKIIVAQMREHKQMRFRLVHRSTASDLMSGDTGGITDWDGKVAQEGAADIEPFIIGGAPNITAESQTTTATERN